MHNKQCTYSLPSDVNAFKKERAKRKALNMLALLQPIDWNTNKDAANLVQEARWKRAEYLSNHKL